MRISNDRQGDRNDGNAARPWRGDGDDGGGSRRAGGGARATPGQGTGDRRMGIARPGRGRRRAQALRVQPQRSEENTSELQSLMRTYNAVFCLKNKQDTQQKCTK